MASAMFCSFRMRRRHSAIGAVERGDQFLPGWHVPIGKISIGAGDAVRAGRPLFGHLVGFLGMRALWARRFDIFAPAPTPATPIARFLVAVACPRRCLASVRVGAVAPAPPSAPSSPSATAWLL